MTFTAIYHAREAGFGPDIFRRIAYLRQSVDQYYRGAMSREAAQAVIDAARGEDWYAFAFLPRGGTLPDNPEETKWFQEMDFDPTEHLVELQDPMLVIYGMKDRWVPVSDSFDAIAESVSDATLLELWISPESGHLMSGAEEDSDYMGELPVEPAYIEAMVTWINALEPRAQD